MRKRKNDRRRGLRIALWLLTLPMFFIVSMAGGLLEVMGRIINEAVDALDSAING